MRIAFGLILAALLSATAMAVEPDEILDDPVLEARARALSQDLRCVVCQNENIDSSNAGVARTMRILLRERLVAGDSDQEIRDFFVARYGDYVLFEPPFNSSTLLLWTGPALIFGAGALATILMLRRRSSGSTLARDLNEAEEAALAEKLREDDRT